ncbi:MAG: multicopper oxidase domain-containing protein [Dehalococcoidia bacterium]
MHMFNKRRLKRCLFWAGSAAAIVALLAAGVVTWLYSQASYSNVGELTFVNRLAIPELLDPVTDERGRKVFDLTFTAGEAELLPGKRSATWGLNGPYLSPTLRASRGDEVVVNVTNAVDEPTSLHWHGMHLPAAMDGGPHQVIRPGETWSPAWTINQPAASLWFHPHLHESTADHVYRGAAGMFLLDDEDAAGLDIPGAYGLDDVPLIIQDKRFNSDGSLNMRQPVFSEVGILGDEILVNGTHDPYFEATTSLVRFRVLNASNARIYNLGFSDDREFSLIATDSGLLEAAVVMNRIQLSPGERAEIVVNVEEGDDVVFRSFESDLELDFWTERMAGGHDTFDVLSIRAADQLTPSPPLPDALVSMDRPVEADAARTRTFELNGHSLINGQQMDMTRVDAAVEAGDVEIWEVQNSSGIIHNFHVHLVHFALLDIDGEEPPPHLRGWKDTVFIPRGSTVRFISRFDGEADPLVPFMFHCHILMHEDSGMMGQFVVTEPGTSPPDAILDVDAGHRQ